MNLEDKIDHIMKKVDKIDRGMYGDTDNKTPGLIDRQIKDEQDISDLKKEREKLKYWLTGFAAAVSMILTAAWHLLKEWWSR